MHKDLQLPGKLTKTVMTHVLRPLTLVIKIVLKLKEQRCVVVHCTETLSRNVTILLKSKVSLRIVNTTTVLAKMMKSPVYVKHLMFTPPNVLREVYRSFGKPSDNSSFVVSNINSNYHSLYSILNFINLPANNCVQIIVRACAFVKIVAQLQIIV